MKLSIVIPCYNELDNIPLIIDGFNTILTGNDIEVVLVDNGSSDGTDAYLSRISSAYPFLRTVRVPVNQGYGFGILSGLKECTGDFIGWTHGDLQTPPGDIVRAWKLLGEHAYNTRLYIKGRRRGRSLFDSFFTVCMSVFELLIMKRWLMDINAQPNIFHRSFYDTWEDPPHDFSLDLYAFFMAKKHRLNIKRFDVVFPPRVHGVSHWNHGIQSKIKFIKRTIDFSLKLSRKI